MEKSKYLQIYIFYARNLEYKHKYSNPFRVDVFMIMASQAFKEIYKKR